MELTTLLGIGIGVFSVVGAMIFKHISFSVFLNPAALLIIFLGTAATILNSYPGEDLKNIGKLFKILFTKQKMITELEIIELMTNLSGTVRREGLLALESRIDDIDDPFIKKAFRLVADGTDEDSIIEILESEISAMEKRHDRNASIFSSAGTYAPTLGVLGAVFGLIAAMASIDDTENMAHAIAAAFIATILGIFTGYVLWNPFAKKLRVKSQHEAILKGMIIEGVLSIQRGDTIFKLQDKLLAVLPASKQAKILEELQKEKAVE